MNAFNWLTEYLKLAGASHIGNNWQCPAHEDTFPSLTMMESNEGSVLLFCHAGCSYKEVMESLGLGIKLLFEPHMLTPKRTFETNLIKPKFTAINYHSNSGKRKYRESFSITHHQYTDLVRMERIKYEGGEKICRWQINEGGQWVYSNGISLNLNELPLYNELEVIRGGYVGEVIVLCESESSVDSMVQRGIYGTTWAGGANSVKLHRLKQVLKDQKILWIPDNDEAGLKCSEKITAELMPISYKWRTLMGLPKEDARDLLLKGELNLEVIENLFR